MIDIHKLTEIFRGPLPGIKAQERMSPASRRLELQLQSNFNPKASSVLVLLYPKQTEWYIPFIQRPV